MITLIVNSVEYSNFESIEVNTSMETLSGDFTFVAFTDSTTAFPFSINDTCKVSVDGTTIITGFVESMRVQYSSEEHTITISGRSKTADVIDSTLGAGVDFNTSITLQQLIIDVLAIAEIPGIDVIDEVKTLVPFTLSEKISAETGITVFDLIERYCRKRQVLITSNGDGDIVITRGQNVAIEFSLVNTLETADVNNVISGSILYDDTDRFNKYIVKSQGNTSTTKSFLTLSNEQVTEPTGQVTDTDIRASRVLYMTAENSSSGDQCRERATWQANVNRARAFKYEATVQGFTNELTGNVWQTNKTVSVNDVFAGLDGTFLIESVSYSVSPREGSRSRLGIVTSDAYRLVASEPVVVKKTSKKKKFL